MVIGETEKGLELQQGLIDILSSSLLRHETPFMALIIGQYRVLLHEY